MLVCVEFSTINRNNNAPNHNKIETHPITATNAVAILAEAQARGLTVIKEVLTDIKNGDHRTPVYRSRVVGKEFNN